MTSCCMQVSLTLGCSRGMAGLACGNVANKAREQMGRRKTPACIVRIFHALGNLLTKACGLFRLALLALAIGRRIGLRRLVISLC